MTSLSQSIDRKYGVGAKEDYETETEGFVIFVRVPSRNCIPPVLVLEKCSINSVGDENFLIEKCGKNVIELDLSYNNLTDWNEICKILKLLPGIQFLNLSFNELSSKFCDAASANAFGLLPNISTLILNGTNVTWSTVWKILEKTPNLVELHLSKNGFRNVDLEELATSTSGTTQFPFIKKLFFTDNLVACWSEVAKLGRLFPCLQHLGLSECKIDTVPASAHNDFQRLQSLSLTSNPLNKLEDVSNLSLFPCLTELRIQETQLFTDFTDHERRSFVIALLPNVTTVNGGSKIPYAERENAERAFIRYFNEKEENLRPPRILFKEFISQIIKLMPGQDIRRTKFRP